MESKNNTILETYRLYITTPSEQNFENLCKLQTNVTTMRLFGGVKTKKLIHERMLFFMEHNKKYNLECGSVYSKESNEFIGIAGLNKLAFDDNEDRVEMVCLLLSEFWNKGYGMELCQALLNHGFNSLKLDQIYFTIAQEHFGSLAIAKKVNAIPRGEIDYLGEPKLLFAVKNYYTSAPKSIALLNTPT